MVPNSSRARSSGPGAAAVRGVVDRPQELIQSLGTVAMFLFPQPGRRFAGQNQCRITLFLFDQTPFELRQNRQAGIFLQCHVEVLGLFLGLGIDIPDEWVRGIDHPQWFQQFQGMGVVTQSEPTVGQLDSPIQRMIFRGLFFGLCQQFPGQFRFEFLLRQRPARREIRGGCERLPIRITGKVLMIIGARKLVLASVQSTISTNPNMKPQGRGPSA